MVQAVIKFNEHESRVINTIKGKMGLKNKSDAVNYIIKEYESKLMEPQLKPEYYNELKKINQDDHIEFNSIDDLKKSLNK